MQPVERRLPEGRKPCAQVDRPCETSSAGRQHTTAAGHSRPGCTDGSARSQGRHIRLFGSVPSVTRPCQRQPIAATRSLSRHSALQASLSSNVAQRHRPNERKRGDPDVAIGVIQTDTEAVVQELVEETMTTLRRPQRRRRSLTSLVPRRDRSRLQRWRQLFEYPCSRGC
jgi:hypothetical protein